VAGNSAFLRRVFRGKGAEKSIARLEGACAAVHAVRYGCGAVEGGQMHLTAEAEAAAAVIAGVAAELVKRTDESNEESKGEFCEA
jgi:hypothetical protein